MSVKPCGWRFRMESYQVLQPKWCSSLAATYVVTRNSVYVFCFAISFAQYPEKEWGFFYIFLLMEFLYVQRICLSCFLMQTLKYNILIDNNSVLRKTF